MKKDETLCYLWLCIASVSSGSTFVSCQTQGTIILQMELVKFIFEYNVEV